MVRLTRLILSCALLCGISTLAISQDKTEASIEDQLQKHFDSIQKSLGDIEKLLKARVPQGTPGSFLDMYGIKARAIDEKWLLEPYTVGYSVLTIEPGSAAELCGLKRQDVILGGAPEAVTLEEHFKVVERLKSVGVPRPRIAVYHDGKFFITSFALPKPE